MFELSSDYSPAGDQPSAIGDLVGFIQKGSQYQTLVGVTGSGKTFTMANVIRDLQLPTLIMTHNKTLAAQLYSEFKGFFPKAQLKGIVAFLVNSLLLKDDTGTYLEHSYWYLASVFSKDLCHP